MQHQDLGFEWFLLPFPYVVEVYGKV